jgi:transcriptional regulator with XRE-family HTH domain
MPRLSDAIRTARLDATLDAPLMAAMIGVDEPRLQQLEAGESDPRPEELEAYAQVFGVSLQQLAQGEAKRAPLTQLFFRSVSEGGRAGLLELVATGSHRMLGEFMRCTREIAALESLQDKPAPPAFPVPPTAITDLLDSTPPYGGDRLADWFRAELGLGLGPIPSMRTIITEKLGIRVLWVTPEELDPVIEGASTRSPRAAILVNLVEGPDCWWRTRMTLGHELCHLLCDEGPGNDRMAMFSPHARRELRSRWRLFEGFDRLELRAGAFAACLLAPAEAVQQLVGARDVTAEETISLVGKTFGLGRKTAIYRLKHVFRLSQQTYLGMVARSADHWRRSHSVDRFRGPVGLRAGAVEDLALEAFAQGRLDRVRVREHLRLPLSEPLPEHARLTAAQRAPVRRIEDIIRGLAQRYLQEENIGTDAPCFAANVTSVEGGYRVDVVGSASGKKGEQAHCGHLLVSYDLEVIGPLIDASPVGVQVS